MGGLFSLFNITAQQGTPEPVFASGQAARAANEAAKAERSVKILQDDLAKTLLICEALWELLSQRTGLTVKDLHDKLYELDMQDGQLDGKNQRKAVECPRCGRMVSSHRTACLYCGQVIDDSVFRM